MSVRFTHEFSTNIANIPNILRIFKFSTNIKRILRILRLLCENCVHISFVCATASSTICLAYSFPQFHTTPQSSQMGSTLDYIDIVFTACAHCAISTYNFSIKSSKAVDSLKLCDVCIPIQVKSVVIPTAPNDCKYLKKKKSNRMKIPKK